MLGAGAAGASEAGASWTSWASGGWALLGACLGGAGEGLGDFEEGEAELEEGAVQEVLFGGGEIAAGLVGEDGEHVDGLAGAEDVDLGLLALLGAPPSCRMACM